MIADSVFWYFAIGALAGTMAGLLGVGGGIVIVPALILVFGHLGFSPDVLTHLAVGTSLATIVFTSLSSIRTHHSRGAVDWVIVKRITLGILIGALLGAEIADSLQGPWLQFLFGFFAVLISVQVGLDLLPKSHRDLPGPLGMLASGGVIGAISSLFGIGGGSLTVPFLTYCHVQMQRAVGTSSAVGLPIAVAGVLGFIWSGWNEVDLPAQSFGYVYWPAFIGIVLASVVFAQIGARLAHRLPAAQLKKIFAVFLLVVGIRILITSGVF